MLSSTTYTCTTLNVFLASDAKPTALQFCGGDEKPVKPTGDGSWGGIIYADLQLPRASNNGSMRKQRQRERPQSRLSAAPRTSPEPAIEYAVIQFSGTEDDSSVKRTQV